MSVPLKPVADYIVAAVEEAATKTASGLYLPSASQEKPKVANVLAVGPAVQGVKKGDKIVYKSYSQTEIKVDGKEYLLVQEQDVLATVEA